MYKHRLYNWTFSSEGIKRMLSFLFLGVGLFLYVFLAIPDKLFTVPLNNIPMWLGIIVIYSLFSVLPQELLYRTFFFYRYESLFNQKWMVIVVNALVLAFTFFGGLLFPYTYSKTKSIVPTSLEHSLYGVWIFTIGMGEMLDFPMS